MVGWIGLLLLLSLPVVSQAAEHVLAWTYTPQPQDREFVVDSCVNQSPRGCPMRPLATVPLAGRTYTDRHAHPQRPTCYQVGVRDSRGVYQWSNIVCSS